MVELWLWAGLVVNILLFYGNYRILRLCNNKSKTLKKIKKWLEVARKG
jgi:hypothetical protein